MLTQLEARNWRNFRQIKFHLEDRLFVVGPNAAGKSNLLDLFRFLGDLTGPGGGLGPAVSRRGGLDNLHARAARRGGGFSVDISLRESASAPLWRYRLAVRREARARKAVVEGEEVLRGGETLLRRPNGDDRRDPERLRETALENLATNEAFRHVPRFLSGLCHVHLFPVKPSRGSWDGLPAGPLLEDLLSRMERAPPKVRAGRMRKIEAALRLAVPNLSELRFLQSRRGVSLESLFAHWRPGSAALDQHDFSDGTLRLLSILWGVLENETLLLLEEPELSLHPAVARQLPGLIHRLKRGRQGQVILTTHSADILSDKGIAPEEILLLKPAGKEGVLGTLAGDLPEVKALLDQGLSPGEIVLPRIQPSRISELGYFE